MTEECKQNDNLKSYRYYKAFMEALNKKKLLVPRDSMGKFVKHKKGV